MLQQIVLGIKVPKAEIEYLLTDFFFYFFNIVNFIFFLKISYFQAVHVKITIYKLTWNAIKIQECAFKILVSFWHVILFSHMWWTHHQCAVTSDLLCLLLLPSLLLSCCPALLLLPPLLLHLPPSLLSATLKLLLHTTLLITQHLRQPCTHEDGGET